MSYEWIKAPLALQYVSGGKDDPEMQRRICERAHHGLILARAARLVAGGHQNRDIVIGKAFWWAEGRGALEQDWKTGDFFTWIDQKEEVKAFDVSFDFGGISELVPAHEQAAAMRRISVSANAEWISASDLHSAIIASGRVHNATQLLAEACRLGQLGARAMRAGCRMLRNGYGTTVWQAIEWDVPLWFWRDFTDSQATVFQWTLGKVKGEGGSYSDRQTIQLQGLHFHRSGLSNIGLGADSVAAEPTSDVRRGRKPEYDWQAASAAIWGQIYRGELIPENQAAIEKAFIAHLRKGDKEPGESTVRPHAKPIWDEFSKA